MKFLTNHDKDRRIKELEFICENYRWLVNTYNREIIRKVLETSDIHRLEYFKNHFPTLNEFDSKKLAR